MPEKERTGKPLLVIRKKSGTADSFFSMSRGAFLVDTAPSEWLFTTPRLR